MAGEDQEKAEPATGSALLAERAADDQAAASTPRRAPAQEGLLQTPQHMASASAFSVFMSPLVRRGSSGRILDMLCPAVAAAAAPKRNTVWDSTVQMLAACDNGCVSMLRSLPCSAASVKAGCHPEVHTSWLEAAVVTSATLMRRTSAARAGLPTFCSWLRIAAAY